MPGVVRRTRRPAQGEGRSYEPRHHRDHHRSPGHHHLGHRHPAVDLVPEEPLGGVRSAQSARGMPTAEPLGLGASVSLSGVNRPLQAARGAAAEGRARRGGSCASRMMCGDSLSSAMLGGPSRRGSSRSPHRTGCPSQNCVAHSGRRTVNVLDAGSIKGKADSRNEYVPTIGGALVCGSSRRRAIGNGHQWLGGDSVATGVTDRHARSRGRRARGRVGAGRAPNAILACPL